MKTNKTYLMTGITVTSVFLLFVSLFINYYQSVVYEKNTETVQKNYETMKSSNEELKKQLEGKTQNTLDLEFYKKIVNQLEKEKVNELKAKIESVDGETKKELFDENGEVRGDLSIEDYRLINNMLKGNEARISINTRLDYSFRAPSKKEGNLEISLNNTNWLEQLIQNNKEGVNVVNLKFDIGNGSNKLAFTPANLFMFSMFKELDDRSFTNLLSKFIRDEDNLNILTSINKDYETGLGFNFVEEQSLNIKRLYKLSEETGITKARLSEIMITNLERFSFEENRVFKK